MTEEQPKLTEVDLAAHVVTYFQDHHWEVFQEVQVYQGASRADLVVRQGKIVGVVECKQALGLPVLEQAYEWKPFAHFVWAATWYRAGQRSRLLYKILEDYGIGHLTVDARCRDGDVREWCKSPLFRNPPQLDLLTKQLTPELQALGTAAGGNRGGHFTPFKMTCWEIKRIVEESPGITLKEALGKFKHHYSNTRSAMCNLPQWIDKGKVPGVRLDRSSGKLVLVLTDAP